MIWLRRARFLALALVGLVVGHEAVYLAEYGATYQSTAAATGHGYWLTFALLSLIVGGIPLAAAGVGLIRLRVSLRRLAGDAAALARARSTNAAPSYLSEFTGLFPRLYVVIVTGFTVQENVEWLVSGHGVPGLWVLSSGAVLPVLLAISVLVAVAGAWLRWREAVLERRLAAAQAGGRPIGRYARHSHRGALA